MIIRSNTSAVAIVRAAIILYLSLGVVVFAAFVIGLLSYDRAWIIMAAVAVPLVVAILFWADSRKTYNNRNSSINESGYRK